MDVWARKQDMNTKRAIHALAGMNDRLYAIGGNHLKGKHTSQELHRKQVNADIFKALQKRRCHYEQTTMNFITLCDPVVPLLFHTSSFKA